MAYRSYQNDPNGEWVCSLCQQVVGTANEHGNDKACARAALARAEAAEARVAELRAEVARLTAKAQDLNDELNAAHSPLHQLLAPLRQEQPDEDAPTP